MSEVRLSLVNDNWIEDLNGEFKLPVYLKENLDKIIEIQKKDFDAPFIIDGMERGGKSVLGMMCGWYLSKGKLTLNNFARGLSDAAKKIQDLPDKSVLIMDEGSLIFNSKNGTSREVKLLEQIMDVCGQKNLIFIIVLPSFFDLTRKIATRRTKFLIRVVVDKNYDRGNLLFWGEEAKGWLYRKGKKQENNYAVVPYSWASRYTAWFPPWYQEYKDTIKKESLKEILDLATGGKKRQNADAIAAALYYAIQLLMEMGLSQDKIAESLRMNVNTLKVWKHRIEQDLGPEQTTKQ